MYFDVLQTQNNFLQEWKDNACNLHLSEIMELEAPPENQDCMLCHKPLALYRCFNCLYSTQLVCLDCCLLQHWCHPFHQIKKWTGTFFDRSNLGDMGLTINLGHGGNLCPGYKTGLPHTVIDEQRIWDEDSNDDESLEELTRLKPGDEGDYCVAFLVGYFYLQRTFMSNLLNNPQMTWCSCWTQRRPSSR